MEFPDRLTDGLFKDLAQDVLRLLRLEGSILLFHICFFVFNRKSIKKSFVHFGFMLD